jgi:hypothetical protein
VSDYLLSYVSKVKIETYFCFRLTSVHQAALMGNVQILRMLIQTGANVIVQDHKGELSLHFVQ